MEDILFQKTGLVIGYLALDFLSRNTGERVPSVSEYQEKFQVSRGTIQNALTYLKSNGAVQLKPHGHLGTYIESMDYSKLQNCCVKEELMGIMPLPYSTTYEGFATAIYSVLGSLNFNMAYARGAVGRIQQVENGIYQFAVVSKYAAEYAMEHGSKIEVVFEFGAGSFLSRHVLLLRDASMKGITDGMRIAYDSTSIDQSNITKNITRGKQVEYIEIRMQNTISALQSGLVDAGVWNYDDILDKHHKNLHFVSLDDSEYNNLFSTAVIVIQKNDEYLSALLKKYIHVDQVLEILKEVKEGKRSPDY